MKYFVSERIVLKTKHLSFSRLTAVPEENCIYTYIIKIS